MSIVNEDDVVGRECRFAVFCPPHDNNSGDLHFIKEIQHLRDGSTRTAKKFKYNFKRPFWITKKGCQNHEQKKEGELLTRVDRYMTTQSQLPNNVAAALGMPWFSGDPRKLNDSPFVYGTDILSTAVIKRHYQDQFPDLTTPFTVAVFDTEKDMVDDTEQINMATISMGSRVFTAVQSSFVKGLTMVREKAHEALHKYIGDTVKARNIEWELVIVDSEIDVVTRCMEKAHEWQPDFLAVWNIDFDIQMMIKACERAGVDPKFVFSDPDVPNEFKHFRYKQGPKQKKTASDKVSPIKPADQWHTVYTPATFYMVDAMCVYRKIRSQKGEEPSYALDAILQKELGIRKLKFTQADHLPSSGPDWHIFMQVNYKIEYIIYNVFDCVSMELLDEKILDLQIAMPLQSAHSDFHNFKSQPRRTADRLHYEYPAYGQVFGSTAMKMESDMDKETLGLEDWIVTLPAHLVLDNGLRIIKELPNRRTNARAHVADLDVSASYPNGECVFNISKATTKKELCRVEGIDENTQRKQGINLSGGVTNATEFCVALYKLPNMDTMLAAYLANRT
jgi:hypothetical protein